MKVSIIVPIYNKEKYLPECLDTLIGQTYSDIEIILVDDESKDNSGKICDEYASKDARIKVIHQNNTGAAGAWRAGFKLASGEYVMFVDGDDTIDLDMVDRLVANATGRDDEIVISDYVIEKADNKTYVYQTLEPGEYDREKIIHKVIPQLWGYEDRRIHTSRCMKLFSKELIKNNECYSRTGLKFGEDNALSIPCVMDAGRIYAMDKAAMYHYRTVDGSVVHSYDTTLVSSIDLLQKITEQMIEDKFGADDELPSLYKNACVKEFPYLLMYAVKNEVRGKRAEYIENIKKLCGTSGYKKLIDETPVLVEHLSNRLVYYVMKHPTSINCILLRAAVKMWEKR